MVAAQAPHAPSVPGCAGRGRPAVTAAAETPRPSGEERAPSPSPGCRRLGVRGQCSAPAPDTRSRRCLLADGPWETRETRRHVCDWGARRQGDAHGGRTRAARLAARRRKGRARGRSTRWVSLIARGRDEAGREKKHTVYYYFEMSHALLKIKTLLFKHFGSVLPIWWQQRSSTKDKYVEKHLQKYIAQSPVSHL